MNPRTTAILFAVALGLGAFVYFYEIQGEQGRREAEAHEKRLFPDVASDAIEWIRLRTSDGRDARVERRDGAWWLVEPLEFPADEFAVDAIASALEQISSETVYESPQEASVYGLDDPGREVRFAAGGEEYVLHTGNKTPMGGNSYASVGGASPVYTVQTFRVNSLHKTLDDLRDKRILDFDTSAVDRLTASWHEGFVVLARRDGEWRLEAPVEGEADQDTVKDLLSDLAFLRAASFVDAAPPDDETGLDAPAFAAKLEIGAGAAEGEAGAAAEPRRISLAIGSVDDDGERYARAGRPTLYRIASGRLDDFPRELFAYRFKDLARFGAAEARQLDLVFRPEGADPVTITATRKDGTWSAEPEDVDSDRLGRLVTELSRLEASEVMAESMGADELASLGLDPPRVTLVVRGEEDEEPLAELRLGELDGTRGIVAQAAGRPTVFQIDYDLAEHLPVSLDAFRNRFASAEEAAPEAAPAASEPPMVSEAPPGPDPSSAD